MEPNILIARILLNRLLYLLISIYIEAFILRRNLRFTPRESVQYASVMNLFAEIIGCFVFFSIFSGASREFQAGLMLYLGRYPINLVSFNRLYVTVFYFVLYLLVKLQGFEIFRILVSQEENSGAEIEGSKSPSRAYPIFFQGIVSRFRTILRAHTVSYLVNLFIILFQTEFQI
ncbi:MAG: hypothetical protein HC835_06650 [Oscillatoriales cyanobacterium RM2_1_1]|nr:hypothetical protein [Oscillatoriales cyanobacterium SM2_3_0]NJO45327.1 hypothetical protein [Oscillatoriales cyanobacterium RM2_1_1]